MPAPKTRARKNEIDKKTSCVEAQTPDAKDYNYQVRRLARRLFELTLKKKATAGKGDRMKGPPGKEDKSNTTHFRPLERPTKIPPPAWIYCTPINDKSLTLVSDPGDISVDQDWGGSLEETFLDALAEVEAVVEAEVEAVVDAEVEAEVEELVEAEVEAEAVVKTVGKSKSRAKKAPQPSPVKSDDRPKGLRGWRSYLQEISIRYDVPW